MSHNINNFVKILVYLTSSNWQNTHVVCILMLVLIINSKTKIKTTIHQYYY